VCSVETGQTTVTWTVSNQTGSAISIAGSLRGVFYNPNPVPAGETATATETIAGPGTLQELTDTVAVEGGGRAAELAVSVTLSACTGPEAPEDISFTFTNEASVPAAFAGDTIDYEYCGENNSDVPLEVVQVVDDRLGVLELPDVATIVAPGERICNTDIGLPVSYETTAADAGTTIVNNAVVTVRTVGAEPQGFQAADAAEVVVSAPDIPSTGASGVSRQLYLAALALAIGSALLVTARRRREG
jgi:hypothetical protein